MNQNEGMPAQQEERQSQRGSPKIFKIMNPMMKLMLGSPLHGLMSARVMLISFTGRRSGKRYSTPVAYTREGNQVIVVTFSPWWKNFIEPAPVEMRIRGKSMRGQAVYVKDPVLIKQMVSTLMTKGGKEAMQRMGLWVDNLESLNPEEVKKAQDMLNGKK